MRLHGVAGGTPAAGREPGWEALLGAGPAVGRAEGEWGENGVRGAWGELA